MFVLGEKYFWGEKWRNEMMSRQFSLVAFGPGSGRFVLLQDAGHSC